jgi:hypothetical protein
MLPKKLYHASSKKVTELKPGFQVTGQLVKWDLNESNKYLYAVDEKDDVLGLGIGSAIEKICLIDRFQIRDKDFIVHVSEGEDRPSMNKIFALEIYIYTINPAPEHLWIKNHNKHNGLTNEWKTKSVIPSRSFKVEKLNVKQYLKDKNIQFIMA